MHIWGELVSWCCTNYPTPSILVKVFTSVWISSSARKHFQIQSLNSWERERERELSRLTNCTHVNLWMSRCTRWYSSSLMCLCIQSQCEIQIWCHEQLARSSWKINMAWNLNALDLGKCCCRCCSTDIKLYNNNLQMAKNCTILNWELN